MSIRLAGGVVPGPDRRIWVSDPAGRPVDAAGLDPAPGTAVAVGPQTAGAPGASRALAELATLRSA